MRVLVLHSRYRSGSVSGENRVVDDEVRLLREAGHDVMLWSPSVEPEGPVALATAGARAIWSGRAARAARALVAEHRPDVVHVHNVYPALSPAVLRAIRAEAAPLVMTLHNYRMMCLPGTLVRDGRVCEDCVGRVPTPGVIHRCYRGSAPASAAVAASLTLHRAAGTFAMPDLYLAVSRFLADKHIEAGFQRDRIVVKPNFSWPQERRSGPGDHFLALGRLAPEKGMDVLVEAFRGLDARLVVAGDGPEAASLAEAAPPNVELIGAVPPARVEELLAGARAVLVPSRWYEGHPRVITEAFAAGVPVVASRIGGLPETIEPDVSGLLAEPDDKASWIAAVEQLRSDVVSARLGDGAFRAWESLYSPGRALEALVGCYEDAIARSSRGARGARR